MKFIIKSYTNGTLYLFITKQKKTKEMPPRHFLCFGFDGHSACPVAGMVAFLPDVISSYLLWKP